jgi:L,D-transpeptidase YcbB
MNTYTNRHFYLSLLVIFFFIACNNNKTGDKEMVGDPESMDKHVQQKLQELLAVANDKNGKVDGTIQLSFLPVVQYYYEQRRYAPVWSSAEKWDTNADTLLQYLDNAVTDGLYKDDYSFSQLKAIKLVLTDSVKRTDAALWARAELLYTNAFMHVLQDLKQGRLQPDSSSMRRNNKMYVSYFTIQLDKLENGARMTGILDAVQPTHTGYRLLKSGIRKFVDSMDNKAYTYLSYPYKDSAAFVKKLQKRLAEGGILAANTSISDSAQLDNAIRKYQQSRGLKANGKLSAGIVKMLNLTDRERFSRIAITLDRYKQLPEKMPQKYIWVNLPAYNLKVWQSDSMVMESKVICGKPATPTPLITSAISDIVIYPTWTVPSSIIAKEMLPGLKRNPGYLARKGLNLLNNKGELVDPSSIDWSKYKKGIPYRIQQGSGDDNALGVIKFNFSNPFAVYLHDTNQRYLFKNSSRSLSHGCVRVQDWQKLAFYIVRNDSLLSRQPDSLKYNSDSVRHWIAQKEKRRIDVKNQVPLYIRYFSCELVNGSIKFYDDIYGEDKLLREKYFAGK